MIYTRYFKRALDIALSLFMMIALGWLLLLVATLYIGTLNFPLFFRPLRMGRDHKPFKMLKFRTLLVDDTLPLRERRFPLGNLLRSLSMDELPQMWNVLVGEMSVVGPRPLPVEYFARMSETQRRRNRMRPGITGWAQVNGRNSISWRRKFELDDYYITHASLGLDLLILFKTIVLLLSFRKDVSLTEKPFEGDPGNE